MGSFNSMDVFVCISTVVTDDWVGNNDEAVFFWVGRHATLALQEHGAKVGVPHAVAGPPAQEYMETLIFFLVCMRRAYDQRDAASM